MSSDFSEAIRRLQKSSGFFFIATFLLLFIFLRSLFEGRFLASIFALIMYSLFTLSEFLIIELKEEVKKTDFC